MAWSTPLGSDLATTWDRLLAGATGITDIDCAHPLKSTLAASVTDVDATLSDYDRQTAMAADTIRRTMSDAGLDVDDSRVLPVLGTSFGAYLDDDGAGSLYAWSVDAAECAGLHSAPVTVTTACSAGSDAILSGLTLLREGAAEIVLCGGADVLTDNKRLAHSQLGTLSPDGLRAFDIGHSGTVLGEAAGFLVIEPESTAVARGAQCLGVLAGGASMNSAVTATAPDPTGASVIGAVCGALDDAELSVDDVIVINAHGTGTHLNDDLESQVYTRLFGSMDPPPVLFGTKGSFGHTLGATGAIEAIAVLMALQTGCVPPVHGLVEPLSSLRIPIARSGVWTTGTDTPSRRVGISVTLGFGGFDTCLAFEPKEAVAA